jgi:hypothetical protein
MKPETIEYNPEDLEKYLFSILDRNKLSEEDLADIHHRLFWNIVCEYRINETIIKAYLVGILGEEKYNSLKL